MERETAVTAGMGCGVLARVLRVRCGRGAVVEVIRMGAGRSHLLIDVWWIADQLLLLVLV